MNYNLRWWGGREVASGRVCQLDLSHRNMEIRGWKIHSAGPEKYNGGIIWEILVDGEDQGGGREVAGALCQLALSIFIRLPPPPPPLQKLPFLSRHLTLISNWISAVIWYLFISTSVSKNFFCSFPDTHSSLSLSCYNPTCQKVNQILDLSDSCKLYFVLISIIVTISGHCNEILSCPSCYSWPPHVYPRPHKTPPLRHSKNTKLSAPFKHPFPNMRPDLGCWYAKGSLLLRSYYSALPWRAHGTFLNSFVSCSRFIKLWFYPYVNPFSSPLKQWKLSTQNFFFWKAHHPAR